MNNCKNCMRVAPYNDETEYCPYYLHSKNSMEEFCKDELFNCEAYIYFNNDILNPNNEEFACNYSSKDDDKRLNECPFCGEYLTFHYNSFRNKHNHLVKYVYYSHPENECVLNIALDTFHIPAGDERDGYLGECPTLWNNRKVDYKRLIFKDRQ